jgi:hypothetical protein
MRLSKTAWLILGAGVFIIVMAVLLMLYSQQVNDEEQMEASLADAQALLPQLIAEREDWENQLSQLENQLVQGASALEKSVAKFPEGVESIEYGEEFFLMAHDCDLEIVGFTASEPRQEKVEDTVTYTVTYFEVEVSPATVPPTNEDAYEAYVDDAIANMLDFIDTVVNGEYFTAATVGQVIIEIPEVTAGERPVAIIKLTIYCYQGYESYEDFYEESEESEGE